MFAPGWSVFGEFNCMDFGTKTSTFVPGRDVPPGSTTDVVRAKLEVERFLVGVNYKFNFGGGPVVAKY